MQLTSHFLLTISTLSAFTAAQVFNKYIPISCCHAFPDRNTGNPATGVVSGPSGYTESCCPTSAIAANGVVSSIFFNTHLLWSPLCPYTYALFHPFEILDCKTNDSKSASFQKLQTGERASTVVVMVVRRGC